MPDPTPQTRLRMGSPATDVTNTTPVSFSDPNLVHIVAAGEVVVFAVATTDGETGPRRFLMSAEPGDAIYGVAPTAGFEVVGSGNVGTQVHALPLPQVQDSDEGDALLATWVRRITEGVERFHRNGSPTDPTQAASDDLPASVEASSIGGEALRRLRVLVHALDIHEEARLAASLLRDVHVESEAVTMLSGVLGTRDATAVTASADPLMETCRTVAAQAGIEIVEPEHQLPADLRSALRVVAKASQIRTRRVRLDGTWWTAESGPMVASLRDGQGVVALVQDGSHGYALIDHVRGERHPVDAGQVARLTAEAFVFTKAWPALPLTGRQVLAMGLGGSAGDLWRILGFGLATALLALVTPLATAQLFNEIIPTADRGRLLALVSALVLGAVAAAALQMAQGVALLRFETRSNAALGGAVWDRVLRLPVPFFHRYSIGDLAARTMAIDDIRQILAEAGFSIMLSAVFSLSSLALLFVFDPTLALVATALLGVSVCVSVVLTSKQLTRLRELVTLRGAVSGMVIQQIVGVSKLRVTAAERRAFAQWTTLYARQQHARYQAGKLRNLQTAFNAGWGPFTTLVIFWWLARRGLNSLDPGTFLAFFAAFGQILVANRAITAALGGILQTVPLYERVKPILEATPEVGISAQDPGTLTGGVELNHVEFRYTDDGPLVLRDVSLQIEPGQFVALVGPSGAGKSSLIRLLLGFDHPQAGSILFDGKDLATLDIEQVRRQIGVVLQTAQLMPGSILTNIIGEADLTRDDAWLAAARAGLDGDLRDMPMGMDTLITEGSSTLSGGQRQRLLIARALATQPRLLLFDEATSALDNITQRTVTESLQQLAVTRLVIAHRLSTIVGADKIIVMEAGRIVETGDYEQLLAANGPFAELAERQIL